MKEITLRVPEALAPELGYPCATAGEGDKVATRLCMDHDGDEPAGVGGFRGVFYRIGIYQLPEVAGHRGVPR